MDKQSSHQLAEFGFQRILPAPALRPFVKWFWSIQSEGPVLERHNEFMHSHGSLSLLFNWGDELNQNNGVYSQTVSVEGARTDSRQLILSGNVRAFGILFRAGGAFPLFGIPMSEFSTSAESSFSLPLHDLHEQLAETSELSGKVEHVESWLFDLLDKNQVSTTIVPSILKLIETYCGQKSIKQIAGEIRFSERQLERLFKKEVGLTPIKYAGLIRLHQARLVLKHCKAATLTEVAQLAGYYDQAHFCSTFKKTIGVTPGDYLSRQQNR